MRVYLYKDVPHVGHAGEIIKVSDGFARNSLFPRKLAEEVTPEKEAFFKGREKVRVKQKEKEQEHTSDLANAIQGIKLTLKRKMHDDGKLYASVREAEVVALLAPHARIKADQVIFDKSIKAKGNYEVTIKLSSRLQPTLTLTVVSE